MNTEKDLDRSARLASMAARLLALVMEDAQASSNPATVAEAAKLHDERGLYPRLTIAMPHRGGAVKLELVLCDPTTDEPLVSMFEGTAS